MEMIARQRLLSVESEHLSASRCSGVILAACRLDQSKSSTHIIPIFSSPGDICNAAISDTVISYWVSPSPKESERWVGLPSGTSTITLA